MPDSCQNNLPAGSVVSAPRRGPWGNPRYRGNCDGTLTRDLILRYNARRVADPMMGSGTTRDVVADLNTSRREKITFWGADLKTGFDARIDAIPEGQDFVWIHPPYHDMIRYSDNPRDLSNCDDYGEFRDFLQQTFLNCYRALALGGRLAVLVGDLRRNGQYTPIVRDVLNLEGRIGRLRSILIKTQHNCASDGKTYGRLEDPRITHEYCVLFKRC